MDDICPALPKCIILDWKLRWAWIVGGVQLWFLVFDWPLHVSRSDGFIPYSLATQTFEHLQPLLARRYRLDRLLLFIILIWLNLRFVASLRSRILNWGLILNWGMMRIELLKLSVWIIDWWFYNLFRITILGHFGVYFPNDILIKVIL